MVLLQGMRVDIPRGRGINLPTMSAVEKEAQTIEPWAAAIAIATLLVVAGVAAFTAWDRMHTAQLETVITPTAVGDTQYVKQPPGGKVPTGLKCRGKALDMVGESKVRDAVVLKVGSDDTGVYGIYRPEDEKALPKEQFYMKAGTNLYIEVKGE